MPDWSRDLCTHSKCAVEAVAGEVLPLLGFDRRVPGDRRVAVASRKFASLLGGPVQHLRHPYHGLSCNWLRAQAGSPHVAPHHTGLEPRPVPQSGQRRERHLCGPLVTGRHVDEAFTEHAIFLEFELGLVKHLNLGPLQQSLHEPAPSKERRDWAAPMRGSPRIPGKHS